MHAYAQVRHTDNGPRTFPLGWGALPLFSPGNILNHGLWALPCFHPPARMDATIEELPMMKPLAHLIVYCRLVPARPEMLKLHDSFIINPEVVCVCVCVCVCVWCMRVYMWCVVVCKCEGVSVFV